jgi:hypothetical protein
METGDIQVTNLEDDLEFKSLLERYLDLDDEDERQEFVAQLSDEELTKFMVAVAETAGR